MLADEAARLNRAFFTYIQQGRPFVTLKAALSLDGMVAARRGARTALTGPDADALVHRERAEVDAIGIGSETMLVDDPLLTARGVYRDRPLTRVVFDRRLRTPPTARLFSTLAAGPVVIAHVGLDERARRRRVRKRSGRRRRARAVEDIAGDDRRRRLGRFLRAALARLAARTSCRSSSRAAHGFMPRSGVPGSSIASSSSSRRVRSGRTGSSGRRCQTAASRRWPT